MGNTKDLTGNRVGRWTVIKMVDRSDWRTKQADWLCRCDCGTERVVFGQPLRLGTSRSCGCLQRELAAESHRGTAYGYKHGHSPVGASTPEYRAWAKMKDRCHNERCLSYPSYGGRGITVCDRWRESFAAFLEDMGERPAKGLSLDRIDNDGNYEPGNCRWATQSQQNANRRPYKHKK